MDFNQNDSPYSQISNRMVFANEDELKLHISLYLQGLWMDVSCACCCYCRILCGVEPSSAKPYNGQ
jgi:hypothetical protein